MDPSFLFAAGSLLQQSQINKSIAGQVRREQELIQSEQELLEHKKQWIRAVQVDSDRIVRESKSFPLQSTVQTQIYLHDFGGYEFKADDFDDNQEKEAAVLLCRKLTNLYSCLDRELTDDQKAVCQKALDAIFTRRLIQYAAPRVEAYEKWQRIQAEHDQITDQFSKHVRTVKRVSWILGLLWITSYLAFALLNGISTASQFFIVWFMGALVFIFLPMLIWYHWKRPINISDIQAKCQQAYEEADLDNEHLWEMIQQKFDGVPDIKQMGIVWDEQEEAIQAVEGR